MNPDGGPTQSDSKGAQNLNSGSEVDQTLTFDSYQLISDVRDKGIILPHEQQQFNWDCGIACLRMVRYLEVISTLKVC